MSSTKKRPPGKYRGYKIDWHRKPSTLCRVAGCPKDKDGFTFCTMHVDRIEKNLFKKPEEYCAERLMKK
jgi:hypothetical protein